MNVVVRKVIRCVPALETTISSTGRRAGIVTVGGLTEPFAAIVNRAGTRTLIEAVGVLAVVFVVAVWVNVTVVCAGAVGVVVVSGGVVSEAVEVDDVELDLEPPQPASASAPKRTASPLTFAG